ncbi:MAG: hypothetical protein HYX89_06735 [Chloroflexi bacterium]|nr:hypothetical protein [Chloroflexota bacterium]
MSSRRKRRRAQLGRLGKPSRRSPLSWWLIALVLAIVLAVGLARTLR